MAGREQDGLVEALRGSGSAAARPAGEDPLDHARPGVDDSPSRTAGEVWQKPRQTVSASETAPSPARSPSAKPEAVAELATWASAVAAKHAVPVQTRTWRAPRGCSRSS